MVKNMKYGIFKLTAKYSEHKAELLYRIFREFLIQTPDNAYCMKALGSSSGLAESKNDMILKSSLFAWKERQKYEDALSRSHVYSTKYFIHQCDENGKFLPSKRELKQALEVVPHTETELNKLAKII